jgi:hypothetical protein
MSAQDTTVPDAAWVTAIGNAQACDELKRAIKVRAEIQRLHPLKRVQPLLRLK